MSYKLTIFTVVISLSSLVFAEDIYRQSIISSGSDVESQTVEKSDVNKAEIKKARSRSKFIGTDSVPGTIVEQGDDNRNTELTRPKFTGVQNVVKPLPKPTLRPPTKDDKRDTQGGERKGQAPGDFSQISRSVSNAPIWNQFKAVFSQCAPGCKPYGVGTWRKNNGGRSCHHSGQAVDMFGFSCNGKKYSAYTSRYAQFVSCVSGKKSSGKKWIVLHKQKTYSGGKKHCHNGPGVRTICHWDHAHFSLGCIAGGRKYW